MLLLGMGGRETMTITAREIGADCAIVELELGPPHNQKIELGTYSKLALFRLTQELEHDMDWLNDVANKMIQPNATHDGRRIRRTVECVGKVTFRVVV